MARVCTCGMFVCSNPFKCVFLEAKTLSNVAATHLFLWQEGDERKLPIQSRKVEGAMRNFANMWAEENWP